MKTFAMALLLCCAASLALGQIRPGELRVARGSEDYPPKEMHVNGKLTGLHIEVIEAVAARIGLSVVWQELPWARAQKCAERGECDAISYISPSAEREAWGLFLPDNVLSQVEMRFMVHKDSAKKISFEGDAPAFVAGKTLLTLIGYNYGPEIAKSQKYEVADLAGMATMMKKKRYDVAVINTDDFDGLKSSNELMLLNPPVWISKAYVAFSINAPDSAGLSANFQAAYRDFKRTKEYAGIVSRYQATSK